MREGDFGLVLGSLCNMYDSGSLVLSVLMFSRWCIWRQIIACFFLKVEVLHVIQGFGFPAESHPILHRMHRLHSLLDIGIHIIGSIPRVSRHAASVFDWLLSDIADV